VEDEIEPSSVTGRPVASIFLKKSAVSGKKAEPSYFGKCEFTSVDTLLSELSVSEISGKRYRSDEQARSAFSGKTGHKSEFTECQESHQTIARVEAERCEITGKLVRPGVLVTCDITGKHVLPSECLRCAATGKRALKQLFVTSSISQVPVLESVAVPSSGGNYCLPIEARNCDWSDRKGHPDDIRICELTGLSIHFAFATNSGLPRLKPLIDTLDGVVRAADESSRYSEIAAQFSVLLSEEQCRVEAAALSPTKNRLAVSIETKSFMGLRVHQTGAVYSIADKAVIGRFVRGKRRARGWSKDT
jgi:hypothetical protein